VHYGESYANAFWSGNALVVGDGDGTRFMTFALVDVLTHEMCHALPELRALVYKGQTGALIESICDVLGILAKQWSSGQTVNESNWVIGEGVYAESVIGEGIRSMRAPGTAYDDPVLGRDPQFATMREYVDTTPDSGGVHVNVGIPNHAYYLASEELGGRAWETTGKIWYDSLSELASTTEPTFVDFAQVTIGVAKSRYGPDSAEHRAVEEAWRSVGVLTGPRDR
jgi:Zn-dependent metalloprotease